MVWHYKEVWKRADTSNFKQINMETWGSLSSLLLTCITLPWPTRGTFIISLLYQSVCLTVTITVCCEGWSTTHPVQHFKCSCIMTYLIQSPFQLYWKQHSTIAMMMITQYSQMTHFQNIRNVNRWNGKNKIMRRLIRL